MTNNLNHKTTSKTKQTTTTKNLQPRGCQQLGFTPRQLRSSSTWLLQNPCHGVPLQINKQQLPTTLNTHPAANNLSPLCSAEGPKNNNWTRDRLAEGGQLKIKTRNSTETAKKRPTGEQNDNNQHKIPAHGPGHPDDNRPTETTTAKRRKKTTLYTRKKNRDKDKAKRNRRKDSEKAEQQK